MNGQNIYTEEHAAGAYVALSLPKRRSTTFYAFYMKKLNKKKQLHEANTLARFPFIVVYANERATAEAKEIRRNVSLSSRARVFSLEKPLTRGRSRVCLLHLTCGIISSVFQSLEPADEELQNLFSALRRQVIQVSENSCNTRDQFLTWVIYVYFFPTVHFTMKLCEMVNANNNSQIDETVRNRMST